MTTQRARHPRPAPPGRTQRGGPLATRAPAAARVLALQRQAGNRAVGRAAGAHAANGGAGAAEGHPRDRREDRHDPPALVLVGRLRPPRPRGRPRSQGALAQLGGRVALAGALEGRRGGHAAGHGGDRALEEGKPYARIKVHGAVVSAYSTGAGSGGHSKPVETWSLNADGVEWELPGGDGGGSGDGRGRRPAGRDVWDVDAPG
jgi:hypothetical protein